MEGTEHNPDLERMIRSMATEGMEEWMGKRMRRMKTTTTVAALIMATTMPVISYAFTPSAGYDDFCSTSGDVSVKDIRTDAERIYFSHKTNNHE